MSELTLAYKARSYSTGTLGRAICNARTHHFVSDNTGGDEVYSGELFLSGIAACAVNMVERIAHDEEISLEWMDVGVESWRDLDKEQGTAPYMMPSGSTSRCGVWQTTRPTNWWRHGNDVDRSTDRSPWRPLIPPWTWCPTRRHTVKDGFSDPVGEGPLV